MSLEEHEAMQDHRQYITFLANGQEYAARITTIREIRGWTDTTPLPHVPSYVRGVINLRGIVLPVIDLKARLGMGLTEATVKNVIIVVETDTRSLGLLVDAVSDILTVGVSDIQPVPDVVSHQENQYVNGIVVIDGRMVTLLGMEKLTASFNLDEIPQAA